MALFKEWGRPENDPGTWIVFGQDPDSNETVRFKLRHIPDHIEHSMRKKLRLIEGGVELKMDDERRLAIEKTTWALLDSEHFVASVADEEGATRYTKLLGRTISVGDDVCFDGALSESVKRHLLTSYDWLRIFVMEEADKLTAARQQRQEELRKNS